MSKFKKHILIIFTLITLLTLQLYNLQAQVQSGFDSTLAARLQFLIDSIRTANNYKGVSAAVIIPGQGTWLGVSGVSYSGVNITPGMKFGIASNTKAFISVLMLKLAELNVLHLDDSLDRWLPNFQYVDSTITIRRCLNHRSRIYSFTDYPGFFDAMDSNYNWFWSPESILASFMNPPYGYPRYSNTNYILAGMIIRNATNSTVSSRLRYFILSPLNLTNTFFDVEETVPDTIAHAWEYGADLSGLPRTSHYSAAYSAGAMFSTAENLARWYQGLFAGQIISQSSLDQMLITGPVYINPNYGYLDYGLGIARFVVGGRKQWGHGGVIRGYQSEVRIDSSARFSISVIINQIPSDPVRFVLALNQAILNSGVIGINKISGSIPKSYNLFQNYPNPFNPSTVIRFQLPVAGAVKLIIFDILGREVSMLVNEELKTGTYKVDFDGSNYSSGMYFYRLTVHPSMDIGATGDYSETKKMVLIK